MTKHFPIPESALLHHTAVLGKTGAGKSHTARLIIEHVVAQGARVCVLDPIKSDWWGLISSADGKKPGLPFHVLGGPHGHVPLHSGAGKAIGELVAHGDLPLSIVDMADFEPGGVSRFFVDFCQTLHRRMRGAVYLVLEEAHEFAPKERSGIGQENMAIHWAKKLATAGRSKGVRLLMVTQRTQSLHNALLGSCETVIVHRLTSPADQAPVLKWLAANVSDAGRRTEIANTMSSLPTGTGWLCSGEAQVFERVAFPRIRTFDNTATPTGDSEDLEVASAKVDVERLREIIGTAVEEAEANDPELLKKRIRELERQISTSARAAAAGNPPSDELVAENAVLRRQLAMVKAYAEALREAVYIRDELLATIAEAAAKQLDPIDPPPLEADSPTVAAAESLPQNASSTARETGRFVKQTAASPAQRFLDAIAWWGSIGVNEPTNIQLRIIAGYSPRSGTFDQIRAKLKAEGLVEYGRGGTTYLTDAGKARARQPERPMTLEDIHNAVCAKLSEPEQRMLRVLLDAYPRPIENSELRKLTGYSPRSGTFDSIRGKLNAMGLVDYSVRGHTVAHPLLFPITLLERKS